MTKTSTKTPPSRGRKELRAPGKTAQQPATAGPSQRIRLTAWHWPALGILVGAAVVRLVDLTGPVLHHDEGVNGNFLTILFRTGFYHYNPENFHGPTLYYFAWLVTTINSLFVGRAGLSTFAIRLVTVIFGLGVIWLLLSLRRQLGDFGTLAAAALVAVSAGFVYFSRYFIHEILFVFFTLAIVVAWLRFRETAKQRYVMLLAVSAALLGASKETWIITIAVWLTALPCTIFYSRLRAIPPGSGVIIATETEPLSPEDRRWMNLRLYGSAALLFIAVWVLFYSSFFTNFPRGVLDSIATFGTWFKTSSSAHRYLWDHYFVWLWQPEAPVLILGGLGLGIAVIRATNRFIVFVAFWAMGTLAAYSLIAYKTPWLALNILLPCIILAGYGLEWVYRKMRWLAALALIAASGYCLYQAIQVSFYRYDDDSESYVYAHTRRDLLSMVDEIDSIAAGNPAGKDIGITVMSPEYWPLPWYLRDYKNAGFWGKKVDSNEPILLVHEDQVPEVEQMFGSRYRLIRSYDLRPGNRLYLFLRGDVQR